MRIAFITDLHFGRLTAGAPEALLADLRAQQPDLILIGGDVTQRGFHAQYRECQKFLAALPAPWLCIIGNHDVPAFDLITRFIAPYAPYQKFITRDLNPTFVNEEVAVLGLNSARRMMREWAWEQGSISPRQLDLAREFFAAHTGKYKILMVHHPITHPAGGRTRMLVENHEAALQCFLDCRVDLLCTGHLHRANIQPVQNVIPSAVHPMQLMQGSTTLCDRLRGEPNSYWVIELKSGKPEFTLKKLDGQKFI